MFLEFLMGFYEETSDFCGRPHEIKALRKVLGWSRQRLGEHLGVYVGKRDCETVRRWEKGICRPRPHFRAIMCGLATKVSYEYRLALAEELD